MDARTALRLLITAFISTIPTNPTPIAFWMPTAGPRAGLTIWGNPDQRSPHRPEDDPATWEFRELIMGWSEFVSLTRNGHTPEQINNEIHDRAARIAARYGV